MTLALVDCDSFYASAERVFRPDLKDQPICVASNNDGCVIARSKEAKALGIPMGAPLFKHSKALAQCHVFSANFALYGDMSSRVMTIVANAVIDMEIYSIDECFADLDGIPQPGCFAKQLRARIRQWTGIPVSIGIAATKTLTKIASKLAKTNGEGVCDLSDPTAIKARLQTTEITDVWGIGKRWGAALNDYGIDTAWDLHQADIGTIRKRFGVVMERTVRELRGTPCITTESPARREQIIVSRSFRERVCDVDQMHGLLTGYISRAAEKLRADGSVAKCMSIFIRTSPWGKDPQYSNAVSVDLGNYTADTAALARTGKWLLKRIYKDGYRYQKAGVMLFDTAPLDQIQLSLLDHRHYDARTEQRMAVLDQINQRFGQQSLRLGIESKKRWFMFQENLSPAYTTRWRELPVVG